MSNTIVGMFFQSYDRKKLYEIESQIDRIFFKVKAFEGLEAPHSEVWATSRFNGYKLYNSIAELKAANSGGKPVSSEAGTAGAK